MVMIEKLDEDAVRELIARTDELGVLSVYVDADVQAGPGRQAARIDLKNRLTQLRHALSDTEGADRGHRKAQLRALERLEPRLAELVEPAASGRSRMLFAALAGSWSLDLESALPASTRVVLDSGPFVHPLLEMLDEGRTAGAVLVWSDGAELLEWRLGRIESLRTMELEYVEAPHERAGQLGGGPQGQYNTPMREQQQARGREHTERFLDDVVHEVERLAGERRWERVLVSGGDRWTDSTLARFSQGLREISFSDPRVLHTLAEGDRSSGITEQMRARHTDAEAQLIQRIQAVGPSGQASMGVSQVAQALNEGRIRHLVYDPLVRYRGGVDADGALYASGEQPPGGIPVRQDPRFTERLVQRALDTGARLSPVEGAAAGALQDCEGTAGLLRW